MNKSTRIKTIWDNTHSLPGGKHLFNRIFSWMVPYAGTIHPKVRELGLGYAVIEIEDRRKHRNHLKSIHAIALANLAEMTTGLGLAYTVDENTRFILKNFEINFEKKARGTIQAEAHFSIPTIYEDKDISIDTVLKNESAEVVATAVATWRLGRA